MIRKQAEQTHPVTPAPLAGQGVATGSGAGLATRITLAVGALALLASLAALATLFLSHRLSGGVDRIAIMRMEQVRAAAQLVQSTGTVAAKGSLLLTSSTISEIERVEAGLHDQFLILDDIRAELASLKVNQEQLDQITLSRADFESSFQRIIRRTLERNSLVEREQKTIGEIRLMALELARLSGEAGLSLSDAEKGFRASLSRMLAEMTGAVGAAHKVLVNRYEKSIRRNQVEARRFVEEMPPGPEKEKADSMLVRASGLAMGEDGILALVQRRLHLEKGPLRGAIADNERATNKLITSSALLLDMIQQEVDGERMALENLTGISRIVLAALAVLAILAAVGMALFLRRNVVRRLVDLRDCMYDRARGRDVPIPVEGRDEISDMAASVKLFAEEIERRERELAEERDRASRANRLLNDSITYARYIQDATLPAPENLEKAVLDLAVLWRPLQTVGGDYYWWVEDENSAILILADCTGHGVPGAFMTLILASALDLILADGLHQRPSDILSRIDGHVRARLRQENPDQDGSDDGLEAAVCRLDRKTGMFSFASAGLPVFLWRDQDMKVFRGRKSPLAYRSVRPKSGFPEESFPLDRKMRVVLCTDGIIEQPGGKRGLLLGRRRLGAFLHSSVGLPLPGLLQTLEKQLADWRGREMPRDDMTLLAFDMDPGQVGMPHSNENETGVKRDRYGARA